MSLLGSLGKNVDTKYSTKKDERRMLSTEKIVKESDDAAIGS